MKTVYEEEKEIPITHSSDVVVLGGGPSGVSAAISAARMGADVTLIERFGYLGGQATGGLVILLCSLTDGKKPDYQRILPRSYQRTPSYERCKRVV